MASTIFSGNDIKLLKSNLDFNGNAKILSGSVDPTSSATSAPIGSLYLNTSNGNIYKKQDAGSSTNWVKISSGGDAGINYITNSDAEQNTNGWGTYADAAGAQPVDGSGGSPTLTFTRTTSSPLRGTGSFLVTKDAANRQGEGSSFPFAIDSADQAKMLSIEFDYAIASGTFSGGSSSTDSDQVVYIYDVTNGVLIQPIPYKLEGSVSGVNYKFRAQFQSASNSTSYRLIIHTATTSASAYTVKLDNVKVGPIAVSYTTPVTDWISYTPTVTNLPVSTNAGKWRRVGDSMEIETYHLATGAGTGTLKVSIPSGYSIDTTKGARGQYDLFGVATGAISSTNYIGHVIEDATSSSNVIFGGPSSATWAATLPATWANGSELFTRFTVPISGWSSSAAVSQSDSAEGRVVAARYTTTGNTLTASLATITFGTKSFDTHNAMSGSSYTIPVPGKYAIKVSAIMAAATLTTTQSFIVNIFKNGGTATVYSQTIGNGATGAYTNTAVDTIDCVAGDVITVQMSAIAATTLHASVPSVVIIERVSGSQSIRDSESVNCKAILSSNQVVTNGSTDIIIFNSTTLLNSFDTHGSFNTSTGRYVCSMPGKYRVSMYAATTAALGSIYFVVYVNGAAVARINGADVASNRNFGGSVIVKANAGDIIDLRLNNGSGSSGTVYGNSADTGTSALYIDRIGN